MALFKAEDIKGWKPYPIVIECNFFKVPEGEPVPFLTIEMSREAQDVYREVEEQYHFGTEYKASKKGNKKNYEPVVVNDPVKFCHGILKVSYLDSQGIIDEPSKELMLELLPQEPKFTKKLASKLIEIFEHDEKYKEEADDEKN